MDRLDAIRVFVRVVESRSFSAVARELGVGQPTVSKQIAGLERYLGAQLLLRTSHAVRLTDAGRDFFESSSRLLEELEAAESRIGRGLQAPSGRVRVSVAPSFGALYLVPRLREFFRRFPDVSIEVLATDRTTNLVEDGIDVAIRNGELADSSLVARRVGSMPIVVVAAQAPYWLFAQDLSAGTVLRILRKYEPPALPISAVRPASRRLATKVSVFIDFVAETLAQVPPPP